MIQPSNDRISLFPPATWWHTARTTWRLDAQAGVTVAIFAVPQAMAYAVLAGVAPVYGLYAAIVMSLVGALWGSSPWNNTGPTITAALLTASALAPYVVTAGAVTVGAVTVGAVAGAAPAANSDFFQVLWTFTLMVGVIRLGLGLLRAGPLVRLMPEHALLGFTAAAAVLIALGQLHEFFGVEATRGATGTKIAGLITQLPQTDLRALAIGSVTLAILFGFDRFAKRLPIALGAIGAATLLALMFNRFAAPGQTLRLVRDIEPIPAGLPNFSIYALDWGLVLALLPGALAVAVIGLLEAISISSMLSLKNGQRVNYNQEFFGQGLAQIAGGFFSGFPGSASFSRSALVEAAGGKTAFANVVFSAATAATLLLMPRVLEAIPLAALGALLLHIGTKLIDTRALARLLATSRADFAVALLTFVITFLVKIEWGFFVGLVGALIVFVARARELQLFEVVPRPGGRWMERPYTPGSGHPSSDVVALALHGDVFFGLASELREQLGEIARLQKPRFIIVRLRRAHSIDASCWTAFSDFARAFAAGGGSLILTGVDPAQARLVRRTGLDDVVLVPRSEATYEAFEIGLDTIASRLDDPARLSPAWQEWLAQRETRAIDTPTPEGQEPATHQ